jgi:hypothetical protein
VRVSTPELGKNSLNVLSDSLDQAPRVVTTWACDKPIAGVLENALDDGQNVF